jgi:3',5'-cyclic AMP phosphodiesterase CpdA
MVLVQLSDPHIGATWAEGDPAARLAAAVDSALAVVPRPHAVLVSGDLADHAADDEYREVADLLAPLAAPVYVVPGNHDDRAALRRHFDLPGAEGEPVLYAADLGPLRLVVLDSTRPGDDAGELDEDRLSWLAATLAAAPGTPTLIAMHHPPLVTGMPVWDSIGLPDADRAALTEIVAAHPQVRRIVGGHLHRTIFTELGGRSVVAVPSTYVQAQLDFHATEIELSGDPPGFAVHTIEDGALVSHVQPVG